MVKTLNKEEQIKVRKNTHMFFNISMVMVGTFLIISLIMPQITPLLVAFCFLGILFGNDIRYWDIVGKLNNMEDSNGKTEEIKQEVKQESS